MTIKKLKTVFLSLMFCIVFFTMTVAPGLALNYQNTDNWAGYIVTNSGTVTTVSASWTVPTVYCSESVSLGMSSSDAAMWVGIGGYNGNPSLEQIGTDSQCNGASATYISWIELLWYPVGHWGATLFNVNPGDLIYAEVQYTGLDNNGYYQFFFSIYDQDTSNSYYHYISIVSQPSLNSADWILESTTPNQIAPFSGASFSSAYAIINGNFNYIKGWSSLTSVNLVDIYSYIIASPGSLDNSGDFTFYWTPDY